MMTLYARKECTTCPQKRDVVIYRDCDATLLAGRFPWHYTASKPTRRNRWINHNCTRYRLEWLPDARSIPTTPKDEKGV